MKKCRKAQGLDGRLLFFWRLYYQRDMQRVMIIGAPGSGKSTLARIVADRIGLPVFYMDQIHWKPGWVPRDEEQKVPMVMAIIDQDKWVFEGGHSQTYKERLHRADTVIWLDLPLPLRFFRVVWRTIRDHGKVRPDMAPDCPEGFHGETLDFWLYMWRTRHRNRVRIAALFARAQDKDSFHLQSRSQVRRFIDNLPKSERDLP